MDSKIICSFPPVEGNNPRLLILGTMPGKISLQAQQYYAHPRNAFWRIIGALFGIDPHTPYSERLQQLAECGVVLWDVLQSCMRSSSLDADIEHDSIVPNDIPALLERHRSIHRVCFNGATAAKLFRRHIEPKLINSEATLDYFLLPSTSPAHAGKNFAAKLEAWRQIVSTE